MTFKNSLSFVFETLKQPLMIRETLEQLMVNAVEKDKPLMVMDR